MNFKTNHAPHISHHESTRILMGNVAIVLTALYGLAFYYYGPRALALGVVGIVSSVLTDWISLLIYGKKIQLYELSSLVTGMLIPLMMPATIPYHVVILACVFANGVAKQPFGGVGHNIFNPAAAGYAFALTCFPSATMFLYPKPGTMLPLFLSGEANITLYNSPAFSLLAGGKPGYDLVTMALGRVPGPMGGTNALVLVACLLFLVSRKTLRWETPVSFLLTTGILAFFIPRAAISSVESLFYELMSGLLLFGGIFMLGDPVTTPTRSLAKIIHGVLCGIIVMVYRHQGNLEEGFVFALLILNAAVWPIDMLAEKVASQRRRKRFETFRDTAS